MPPRRPVALGLAAASLALAIAFAAISSTWGIVQSTDSGEDRTLPFHPWAPLWAGLALLGLASLRWWRAWPVVVLGGVGLALGVLSGFSAGFYGIGCGALLLAAGLAGRGSRPSAG